MNGEARPAESCEETDRSIGPRPTVPTSFGKLCGPIGIISLGLALYLPGLGWGLPGTVSWSQDTIAGVRTLGAVGDAVAFAAECAQVL